MLDSGPIQANTSYGPSTIIAFDLRAGAQIGLGAHYALQLAAGFSQVGFEFSGKMGTQAALRGVTAATDRSIGIMELAQRLRIDQSTASRHLRALEQRGLVARKSDPGDRRVSRLVLTEAGRDVLLRTRDVALNDFEVALGDWSPPDRARLAALLERLHADLLRARVDESGWSVGKEADESRPPRSEPPRGHPSR